MPTNRISTKINENPVRQCFTDEPHAKNRFFSLPGAIRRRFWAPRHAPEPSGTFFLMSGDAFGASPGASGTCQGRAKTLPGHLRNALGCHRASREPPRADSDSILAVPEPLPGPILDRFSRPMLDNINPDPDPDTDTDQDRDLNTDPDPHPATDGARSRPPSGPKSE